MSCRRAVDRGIHLSRSTMFGLSNSLMVSVAETEHLKFDVEVEVKTLLKNLEQLAGSRDGSAYFNQVNL